MFIEDKTFHAYECEHGCGTITLMDFKFQKRKPRCPRCGTNFTMNYKGTYKVKPFNKLNILKNN